MAEGQSDALSAGHAYMIVAATLTAAIATKSHRLSCRAPANGSADQDSGRPLGSGFGCFGAHVKWKIG
jgi:hypothetical protein